MITKKYSGFIGGFENAKLLPKTAKRAKREKAKKQKFKLDELRSKMLSETEDMQSWQLTGELGVHKGTEKIVRPKTAAENEEQVSEDERKYPKGECPRGHSLSEPQCGR